MARMTPLPCAAQCRHFAPESSHCRLHGKGIEAPFEQRCERHEVMDEYAVRSDMSLQLRIDFDLS